MVNRAYYSAKIAEFLQHTNSHVVGEIGRHHHQDVVIEQSGAWEAQCELLRPVLSQFVDPQNALPTNFKPLLLNPLQFCLCRFFFLAGFDPK